MNETTTKEHTMSKQVHVSHASCDHDKTPKARAVCRRIRRGGAPETSKAEIVARVKGEDITPVRTTIQSSKKSNKRSKKAKAPVLRELLSYDVPVDVIDEIEDYAEAQDAVAQVVRHIKACEQDDEYPNSIDNEDELPVPVATLNVIAKGSKVVHMSTGSDDDMLFACTKRPINVDSAKIMTNDVTCKNCLKITK